METYQPSQQTVEKKKYPLQKKDIFFAGIHLLKEAGVSEETIVRGLLLTGNANWNTRG